ncbi:L,D-transpeptidase family protein [Jeotgalibaca sp. MA1X17-3]|uniref:L,D-transpeptidase family protein n=1 Tax=Jeotgalibaca sp. MA1X17-3 TaxID=2908211 RepID=UPI001F020CF7|nr:L,D-transpeptidase family protein [Jeotgalibaca sp. MA1X17-3]UJF15944.1 L,D-transpeptidase family protein [Jeotgalibaca sp. MA1X17-3]
MKRKPVIITTVTLIVVLLVAYIGGGVYYKDHFLPKTTLGTIDISGNTIEEANRKIAKDFHAKTITIKEKDETIASFTPSQLDASMDDTELLKQAKAEQGSWSWPILAFQEKKINGDSSAVEYKEEALLTFIKTLSLETEDRTASENASIVNKDDAFVIQPEVQGTVIDQELLKEEIIQSMVGSSDQVHLEDSYAQPAVTKENETLLASLKKMDDLSNIVVTYKIAGKEEIVPKEKIVTWLSVDDKGEPSVNTEETKKYAESLHEKYATNGKTRQFESTNRGTVEVPAGTYGWSIATTAEADNLAAYILAGEDVTVTPAINGSGYNDDGTDIGSNYVEVDLQNQKIYVYKEGQKVFESVIVGGHPKTASPIGVFYAWNKVKDTTLIGYNPRRDADYETPVKYWIPIDWEGIGIHDASWQGSFGSQEYLVNGSNGCINMPPEVMEQFFNLVEVGMPVILI